MSHYTLVDPDPLEKDPPKMQWNLKCRRWKFIKKVFIINSGIGMTFCQNFSGGQGNLIFNLLNPNHLQHNVGCQYNALKNFLFSF